MIVRASAAVRTQTTIHFDPASNLLGACRSVSAASAGSLCFIDRARSLGMIMSPLLHRSQFAGRVFRVPLSGRSVLHRFMLRPLLHSSNLVRVRLLPRLLSGPFAFFVFLLPTFALSVPIPLVPLIGLPIGDPHTERTVVAQPVLLPLVAVEGAVAAALRTGLHFLTFCPSPFIPIALSTACRSHVAADTPATAARRSTSACASSGTRVWSNFRLIGTVSMMQVTAGGVNCFFASAPKGPACRRRTPPPATSSSTSRVPSPLATPPAPCVPPRQP